MVFYIENTKRIKSKLIGKLEIVLKFPINFRILIVFYISPIED